MALFEVITLVAIGGLIGKSYKDTKKERETEEFRINSWQGFTDELSQQEFESIALCACQKIKRLKSVSISGPKVLGIVKSQSKLSEWSFTIDFNDFGKISGTYRITSDNNDSKIPNLLAEEISFAIKNPASTGNSKTCEEEMSYSKKSTSKAFNTNLLKLNCNNCNAQLNIDLDNLQAYCPYCGAKLLIDMNNLEEILVEKEKTRQVEIKESEHTKRQQMEFEYEERKEKRETSTAIKVVFACFLVSLLLAVFMLIMSLFE